MLEVLDMDLPVAALMLKLKEEQAAIKTVTPLELSLRDCLVLSEIPSGACSHFQSFTSLSSSSGFVPPSVHSLPLLDSVSTCDYLLSLVIYPFLRKIFFSTLIHSCHLSITLSLSPALSGLLQISLTSQALWLSCQLSVH